MDKELVKIIRGDKSVTIVKETCSAEGSLRFMFCSNGWQSTGVTISQEEIEMLQSALDTLEKIGVPVTKLTR